ncbi:MAG: DUF1839 family protein [Gemmatimonadota bacterium]|nr:DUF1839 family protein [Gemmatimonadota bacterium]
MTGPIRDLDPKTYERHLIHGEGRAWAETNCYVDVLIELLHGLGFEPIAALPFTFRIDFEGDQWTFFKFPHADVLNLYGLDINELNPWRSLVHHVDEQVGLGRPVLVELDSYFLPDTQGTAYKIAHVKSTVAVNEIDIDARFMGYFHGQSYYHLQGDDFRDIFQLDGLVHDRMLPPYIEYVKFVERPIPSGARELVDASLECFKTHLGLLPGENPFAKFKERFHQDLEWLMGEPIETFHLYSFATLRQYGACFELCETYLRWLTRSGEAGLEDVTETFKDISATAKAFQFQLARAVARRRELSLDPLDHLGTLYERGLDPLVERYG